MQPYSVKVQQEFTANNDLPYTEQLKGRGSISLLGKELAT